MDYNNVKNHMETILRKNLEKVNSKTLPKAETASFNKYNSAWAGVISIDIRDFKGWAKTYQRPDVIRMMQAFTSQCIKIMKENNDHVSTYVNGDEVIGVFRAEYTSEITNIIDTAILLNSAINYLLKDLLNKHGYLKELKCGIGIWVSKDNTFIKYGEKGSSEESFHTLVGDSINWAAKLGKIANKNSEPILMNGIAKSNDENKLHIGWYSTHNDRINNSYIYGLDVRYNSYADITNNKK